MCFYGSHSTGNKLGNHPKNIEPCAHRARTVRQHPLWTPLPMVGLPGPYSTYPQYPQSAAPIWPVAREDFAFFTRWIGCLVARENHLAEVVRSKPTRPEIWGNTTYPRILGFLKPIRVPYPNRLDCWFNPL